MLKFVKKFTDRVWEIHRKFETHVSVLYKCKLLKCFIIPMCNILQHIFMC